MSDSDAFARELYEAYMRSRGRADAPGFDLLRLEVKEAWRAVAAEAALWFTEDGD